MSDQSKATQSLERLYHWSVSEARRWGMSDEIPSLERDIVLERIAELEREVARLNGPRREVIARLEFGGKNCMCEERPDGGCDLLGCPHRKGGNWTLPAAPNPA